MNIIFVKESTMAEVYNKKTNFQEILKNPGFKKIKNKKYIFEYFEN